MASFTWILSVVPRPFPPPGSLFTCSMQIWREKVLVIWSCEVVPTALIPTLCQPVLSVINSEWYCCLASTLASSSWADITRKTFEILRWAPSLMCLPDPPCPYLHTASDPRLEMGTAWEWGYWIPVRQSSHVTTVGLLGRGVADKLHCLEASAKFKLVLMLLCWTAVLSNMRTWSGHTLMPFFT